jgi:thiol-disulfide isomerase/thioredoxin/protocatechuate 3,4-dioxygenase beta subunit
MSAISPLRFALAPSRSERPRSSRSDGPPSERPNPRLPPRLLAGCLGLAKPNPALAALFSLCYVFLAANADDPQPTHLITGAVVDEAGTPVPKATVTAARGTTTQHTVTDADGRFQLAVPAIRPDLVYASLSAETPTGLLGALLVQQSKPEPVRLVVKPGRELSVVVQNSDGQPVADVQVAFIATFRPLARGTTDAAGRWSKHVPSDVKDWTVIAYKGGTGFDYATSARSRGAIADPHPLPDQLTFKLDGARKFIVKCIDRENRPVKGIQVGTWLVQKPGYEAEANLSLSAVNAPITGDDGVAIIDWLPAKTARSWSIKYDAKNLYALDHAYFIPANDPTEELTIKLLPIEQISGRVTHADGRPAEGIRVTAQGKGGGMNDGRAAAQTAADGTYKLNAFSEQAYVVAVTDKEWAAPYRADIVVRAGKPVSGVDFVLTKPTRIHGRVTVGNGEQPVPNTFLIMVIDKGQIPAELYRKDDRLSRPISMHFSARTDADGHYEFLLGPGEYLLQGPPRTESVKIDIPADRTNADIVRDFKMPRAETGPLTVRVVDRQGKPMAGATLSGSYASSHARRSLTLVKTDPQGTFKTDRSLDPLVLHAITADQQLAGVMRSEAEATEAEVVVGPLTTASGRLLDLDGQPLANKEITYGVLVYQGEPGRSPFSTSFGGKVTTDAEGRFTLVNLVPGQRYDGSIKLDQHTSRRVVSAAPKEPGSLDLGDFKGDPNPTKPYVPPTPAERAAKAFAGRAKSATRQRLDDILASAEREYTRPLLLLGGPENKACVDLFRLFDEQPEASDKQLTEKVKSPADLRWEFELLSLDDTQAEVRELATQLGINLGTEPILAVLTSAGSLSATYPLRLAGDKLDPAVLSQFLATHKLPTRDAQKMLADGLRRAQTEDKRLFFIFSASWCGPCRMLAEFLSKHKSELDKHYVFVKLDISRDDHANAVRDQYKGAKTGGVPWFTILDAQGNSLITSNDPAADPAAHFGNSNIGFPSEPSAIKHFLNMLKTTAPRLPEDKLSELRTALNSE